MRQHVATLRRRGAALWAAALLATGAPLPAQQVTAGGLPAAAEPDRTRLAVIGTVRDGEGAALAGAQVHLPALGRSATTDADGRFRIAGVPAGRHAVHVSLLGYAPGRGHVSVSGSGAAALDVVLLATPLTLPGIQVTGRTGGDDPFAAVQAATQLAGRALERELGGTVAGTLGRQAGIAVRSMGPAAALPVMRGLTGDRILVLQDGQRSADLAGSADDHGMTIDPLSALRVEVLRGPATLLYGNNALGGVVNVISSDIPHGMPTRPELAFALQTETAYPGGSVSGRATVPLADGWAVGLRAGGRHAEDMRIPLDPVLGRRLDNTGRREWSGSLGVGGSGARASGGLVLRALDFSYGLPVPPGTHAVSLDGRRVEASGRTELAFASSVLPSARLDASWQDYRHDELDDGTGDVLQQFALRTRTVGLLLRQGAVGPFTAGAWGVSGLFKSYAAAGPEALTPPADSRGLGVFGFQEIDLGGAALEFGGRFDDYRITARETPKFGGERRRAFRAASGSIGLRVPLSVAVAASASATRSFRAPTVEELFSDAAHVGTGAVEVGNAALRAERGTTAEAMLRVQDARWNGHVAVYRSEIRDYVHLVAVGDTVLEGIELPVLAYEGTRAVLRGVEGSIEWALTSTIVATALGDYVRGDDDAGSPLSFMPPGRLSVGLRREGRRTTVGGDIDHRFRQARVGSADEEPTAAFTLFRVHGGIRFAAAGGTHSITLRAENLGNVLHRDATSRIKDFAPAAGRNIAVLYRLHW